MWLLSWRLPNRVVSGFPVLIGTVFRPRAGTALRAFAMMQKRMSPSRKNVVKLRRPALIY